MPILNYTTKIPSLKTIGEIQVILAKAGAKSISLDIDSNHEPEAVTFAIDIDHVWMNFRLPTNFRGVLAALNSEKVQASYRTEAQARRVAWRIVKDWVEAQMALIRANQADLPEVFLPYAVAPSGLTLYQHIKQNGMGALLGSGNE